MSSASRSLGSLGILATAALLLLADAPAAHATMLVYSTDLSGANQEPPNASPGTGTSQVYVDDVAHTMRVVIAFSSLTGTTTACHIHAPTALPGEGTAGVASPTPTFPGFPSGVTTGTYDMTFDMTSAASYNASFLAASGGDPAQAEAALFMSFAAGTAYLNIHTGAFPGGEIRGFYGDGTVGAQAATWGGVKAIFE